MGPSKMCTTGRGRKILDKIAATGPPVLLGPFLVLLADKNFPFPGIPGGPDWASAMPAEFCASNRGEFLRRSGGA